MRFFVQIYTIVLQYWPIKLASLLMASILWIYVQSLQIAMLTISIPVEYHGKPKDLIFEKEPPKFITAELKGKEENLQFNSRRLSASVDLSSAIKGANSYPLVFDQDQLPFGLEISSIPKTVNIKLFQLVESTVKVLPNFINELPKGFQIGRVMILPNQLKILIPENQIEAIQEIKIAPIDLSKQNQTFIKKVPLLVDDNIVYNYSPATVEVRVIVFQENSEGGKNIAIPIEIKNLDKALAASLSDRWVNIYLQGDIAELEEIEEEDFQASVDLVSTHFDTQKNKILPAMVNSAVPVDVKILSVYSNVSIADIKPPMLQVRFSLKPKADSSLQTEDKNKQK